MAQRLFSGTLVDTRYWSRISVVSVMSRAVDVGAQISQKMLAMWGTTDRILPEELDPREVWWRDRYDQLGNYG